MLVDTYKFGSLYVDADMTVANLEESGELTKDHQASLKIIRESNAEFTFDDDYPYGSMYRVDGQVIPLILLGHFGGYPGESLDVANAQAAKEWADGKDHIYAFSTYFGGCESVALYIDISNAFEWDVEEAVELVEQFREYPVLDENLWSEIQSERWEEMVQEMISDTERDRNIVFTEDQKMYIQEKTWEYYGWWEDGYFPEDEWNIIVYGALNPETVQQHQETKLW